MAGDEGEVAGDVEAFDLDGLEQTLFDLRDDVDAREDADAEAGEDEAFEELA